MNADHGTANAISRFDHLVLVVEDLEDAGKKFEALGFTITPPAYHGDMIGTANRLVVFQDNYIELLAVKKPNELNHHFQANMRPGGGAQIIAFASQDVGRDVSRLERFDVPMSGIMSFSRPAERADGSFSDVGFDISVADTSANEMGTILCKHLNPEGTFHSANNQHRNSARRFSALHMEAPDPELTSQRIARYANARSSGTELDLETLALKVTPSSNVVREEVVSATIDCLDMNELAGFLPEHLLSKWDQESPLIVPADLTCGLNLIFQKTGS